MKVLVYPCNSHTALEIQDSLTHCSNISLLGVLEEDGSAFYGELNFYPAKVMPAGLSKSEKAVFLSDVVRDEHITHIYPTTEKSGLLLTSHREDFSATVVGSSAETVTVCASKKLTYQRLNNLISLPCIYENPGEIDQFPVFLKPSCGSASEGTCKAETSDEVFSFLSSRKVEDGETVICSYLPGEEYTVDCISDSDNRLLFCGPRRRVHVSGSGVAINSTTVDDQKHDFREIAQSISKALHMEGAWFFQVKEALDKRLTLLEVSARMSSSMGVYRARGINFALAGLMISDRRHYTCLDSGLSVRMTRYFNKRYWFKASFRAVFFDGLECFLKSGDISWPMVRFCYHCLEQQVPLVMVTEFPVYEVHRQLSEYKVGAVISSVVSPDNLETVLSDQPNSVYISQSQDMCVHLARENKAAVFTPSDVVCLLGIEFVRTDS